MVALHSAVLDSITLLTPWTHRSVLHPCAHRHRSSAADLFTAPLALPVSTAAARPVYREGGRSASSPAARLHQSLERCRLGHSTHKSTGHVTSPVSDAADAARAAEGAAARVHRRPRSVAHGAGVRRRVERRAGRRAAPPGRCPRVRAAGTRTAQHVTHGGSARAVTCLVGGERRQCHVVSGCVCSSSSRAMSHEATHAPPVTVAFTSGVSDQ